MSKISPLEMNLLRSCSASLFLAIVVLLSQQWVDVVEFGLVNYLHLFLGVIIALVAGDTLYFSSLKMIGVSLAMPLSNTYSLFTILLATAFLGESITLLLVLGAIIVFAGVELISTGKVEISSTISSRRRGMTVALIAAMLWSVGTIFFTSAVEQRNYVVASAVRMSMATVLLATLALAKGYNARLHRTGRKPIFFAAMAGLISHGFGSIFYLASLSISGAARATPLVSTSPLFGLILALVLLKEQASKRIWAGSLLIIVGIITVTVS